MKKDKKTAKKENARKDQYTVVLEDLRSNFKAFGEGLMGVREEMKKGFGEVNKRLDNHAVILDNHSAILDSHTEKLDNHSAILNKHSEILESHSKILDSHSKILESHSEKLDSHSKKFESIIEKLDSHTEMIGQLMVDVTEIKSEIKQKVDRSEFARLEKRVLVLERRSR